MAALALGLGHSPRPGLRHSSCGTPGPGARTEARIRRGVDSHSGVPLLTLERLTFRFIGAGFLPPSATLALGLVFGGQLYGARAALRWDDKTAFSLPSWLTFALLLIGRARFGWRGRRAVRILHIGSGLLLLAYVGAPLRDGNQSWAAADETVGSRRRAVVRGVAVALGAIRLAPRMCRAKRRRRQGAASRDGALPALVGAPAGWPRRSRVVWAATGNGEHRRLAEP